MPGGKYLDFNVLGVVNKLLNHLVDVLDFRFGGRRRSFRSSSCEMPSKCQFLQKTSWPCLQASQLSIWLQTALLNAIHI